MGSEMCIRDRGADVHFRGADGAADAARRVGDRRGAAAVPVGSVAVSYTHLTLPTSDLV